MSDQCVLRSQSSRCGVCVWDGLTRSRGTRRMPDSTEEAEVLRAHESVLGRWRDVLMYRTLFSQPKRQVKATAGP